MRGRGESRREGGGERGLGNPRSDNENRLVDAREGATPTSNQRHQSKDPTPQRERRTMQRARAQGREAEPRDGRRGTGPGRTEEKGVSATNPKRVIDVMWKKR